MRTNVFLRSTRRQPVRTIFLLLVIALVTFTFVGRASEYLLIRKEVDRLGSYYRSVGTLVPKTREARAGIPDAAAYLASGTGIETLNRYRYTSALIQDGFCNGDDKPQSPYNSNDVYLYGTVVEVTSTRLTVMMDKILTGIPAHIGTREDIFVNLELEDQDLPEEVCRGMVKGQRYLLHSDFKVDWCRYVEGREPLLALEELTEDGLWFYAVPEGEADFSDPALAGVADAIRIAYDNQRALNIIPVSDMTALPETQELSPDIYLAEGRWLDAKDNRRGSRVCVIHEGFAAKRHLAVGDTLTLELRDVPSCFGYSDGDVDYGSLETQTDRYEIVGIYGTTRKYQQTILHNNTYIPASAVPGSFSCWDDVPADQRTAQDWFNSVLGSNNGGTLPLPGSISFVLENPGQEEEFLALHEDALEELGFRVEFIQNNWENFHTATRPMLVSSFYNVCVYAAVLLSAVGLVVFIYFRSRRREFAVVRSMGLPVRRCVGQITLPMVLIAVPGAATGSLAGWWSTLQSAEQTLSALAELNLSGVPAGPAVDPAWLAGLYGGVLLLVLAVTAFSTAILAKKPVLVLLQGETAVRPKRSIRRSAPHTAENAPDAAALSLEAVRSVRTAGRVAHPKRHRAWTAARFVRRQIVRAPVKSALMVLLAVVFTVGLAAIHLAIVSDEEKVDHLIMTTGVKMDLLPATSPLESKTGSFLYADTAQAILDTGFFTEYYLEGVASGTVITDMSLWDGKGPLSLRLTDTNRRHVRPCYLRSIEDPARYFSENGSGGGAAVTYHSGWDESLFAADWPAKAQEDASVVYPAILPRRLYDRCKDGEGDRIILSIRGKTQYFEIAGVYDRSAGDGMDYILLPESVLRDMSGSRMIYSKASFTVDPSQNRDLEAFRTAIDAIANAPRISSVPIHVAIWDRELTEAVAPLEESLELMRILYPVVFVLSLLTAAGTAVLFVMMSAKEAAALRVLGTPRGRTQVILVLQQAVTCFAGLVLGVTGMLVYIQQARPDLLEVLAAQAVWRAAAYLIAAVAGAAASAKAVTRKNPLEMLQVRE